VNQCLQTRQRPITSRRESEYDQDCVMIESTRSKSRYMLYNAVQGQQRPSLLILAEDAAKRFGEIISIGYAIHLAAPRTQSSSGNVGARLLKRIGYTPVF